MEKLMWPMEHLNISQGENTGSHRGTLNMDNKGRDTGKDPAYAPAATICAADQGDLVAGYNMDGTAAYNTIKTAQEGTENGL